MQIELRPSERLVLRKHPDIANSEWSEENIVLKKSSMPGPFRNKVQPYLAGIMDIFGLPWVRELDLCKGVQTGGTTGAYNCLARESACSSDTVLLAMADEKTVKGRMKNFVIPMYRDSESLSELLSDNPDDTGIYGINLKTGFNIKTGWGTSVASLASDPCRVVVLDEIDKYSSRQNIEEAKDRASTYPDTSKIFALSTPGEEDGPISQELTTCDVVYDFHVECPDCGVRQIMVWEFFRYPKQLALVGEGGSLDYKHIRRLKLAYYQCPHCDSHWDDNKRNLAVAKGAANNENGAIAGWIPREQVDRPSKVGLVLPSWLSRFVSISTVVAEYLEAEEAQKAGDHEKMNHWRNNRAAQPVKKEEIAKIADDHILKFRSELPRNLVPPDTARLALIVDTQQASFYYKVYAYGYAPEIRVQQIRHGIVETFEDLEGILQGTAKDAQFRDHEGREFRIASGVIDSGGTRKGYQKHSRTVEVYEWCSRNRVMMPLKGVHGRTGDLLSYKDVMTFPGTNKRIPGGLKRVNVRVDMFKDDLERRLGCEPDDAQAMSYNADIDEAFAKHYVGETKDAHGDWQHSKKSQRIDYWDCDVYALAHREMIKLRIPRKPAQTTPEQQRLTQAQQHPQSQSSTRPLPGWFRNRG